MARPPVLAVDLGGSRLRVAFVAGGRVLAKQVAPTDPRGPDAVVAQIAGLAAPLLAAQPLGHPVAAAGVAAPGPLDPERGVVLAVPNLAGWDGFPLGDRLAAALGLPAFVHNDASLAALGEARAGAGRRARMLVYLTVSTGVGGGIVARGELLEGAHGLAGELGHLIVQSGGPPCGAGHAGCLEALASGRAIARAAADRMAAGEPTALEPGADARAVARAAVAGDALALAVFGEAADALGIALGGLVNAFDPDLVVLGGGVALGAWDLLVPRAADVAARIVMSPGARSWPIVPAGLGDDSGLVGAAAWAAERLRAAGRGAETEDRSGVPGASEG